LRIIEASCYVPESFLTIDDLARHFKVDKYWIKKRTGIEKIHISRIPVDDMAFEAVKGLKKSYEGIIFVSSIGATYIPHYVQLLNKLGNNRQILGIDVIDGFNGFVKALYLAEKVFRDKVRRVLVVVAEKMSDLVETDNIDTFILFSDAAVAMVVEFDDEIFTDYYQIQDFNYLRFLMIDPRGKLHMEGKQVYKFAVNNIVKIIKKLTKGMNSLDKIVVVPHQANGRILQAVEKEMKKEERNIEIVNYIRYFGNTGSSSIPLALCHKYKGKKISLKNHVLISVSGGMSALGICWREVKNRDENKHTDHEVAEYKISSY